MSMNRNSSHSRCHDVRRHAVLLATGLLLTLAPAVAFNINGTKWPDARALLFTGMPGTSSSGVAWRDALAQAAQDWNDNTPFEFLISSDFRNPCARDAFGRTDGQNGADFTNSVCGFAFGNGTLAVATVFTLDNTLGTRDIVEADVVFNRNRSFDVFDGPLNAGSTGNGFSGVDFRRVALHELGHVMGLGHEDAEQRPAIMASLVGDLFRLQQDDIDGAAALYNAGAACPFQPARFGVFSAELANGDCLINQFMSGGTDDSLVDVYRLSLTEPARLLVEMRSPGMDSALVLMNQNRVIIAIDNDSAGGCDALLEQPLQAGNYLLLANTFVEPTPCGDNQGDYELTVGFDNSGLRTLSGQASFQGGQAAAIFAGGVTVDGGVSYTSQVRSDQAFDVDALIVIDPVHQGKPGFLVVAALLEDGSILVQDTHGEFVVYNPQQLLLPIARSKVLGDREEIVVLRDTVARDLGIEEIVVDFLVGYGVDEQPGELFFHEEPINLVVRP
ncbi:MAG: matrixin family metalloprotease [Pseudomonadales bacterium]|nr:matrixin family metalloprotease [Pseudomonadales bacterium]